MQEEWQLRAWNRILVEETHLHFSLWKNKMTTAPAIRSTHHFIKKMGYIHPRAVNDVKDLTNENL